MICILVVYRRSILILSLLVLIVAATDAAGGSGIAKPGCNESCVHSDVLIPFPFGIGENCYHDSWYEIVCKPSKSSSGSSKPFLRKQNVQVFVLSYCFGEGCHSGNPDPISYDVLIVASDWQNITHTNNTVSSTDLKGSPFSFSSNGNQFVVKGNQGGNVIIRDRKKNILGGCSTVSGDKGRMNTASVYTTTNTCDGLDCCLISMSDDVDYYEIQLRNVGNDSALDYNNTCMNVVLTDKTQNIDNPGSFEAFWYWKGPVMPDENSPYSCSSSRKGDNYGQCHCKDSHGGNPYLSNGCHAIPNAAKKKTVILGLGISLGSKTLLIFCYVLFHVVRRWRRVKRKAKFFKKNGGLLLQQQMTTREDMVDRTKVFSDDELQKATDNFNKNRILGRGGQGTVYKGMLLDGRIVAVKKSLKVDDSQIEDFINEVVILSQINHRNVVKLLGCCLETEVPILVYEFIPNGTLGEHIHNPREDFHITWKMRLQIAAESVGAFTYLHSASGTPIYHRDVKSSNILLDEKYRAKVSDFGTSRTITIDQTHLTTLVHGTFGYMDPEYFQTNQFTEKSDVYSFGVVLVELLTGKKPLTPIKSGGWKSLAMDFFFHLEISCLFDIIDPRILDEAKEEELLAMASLAERCLNLNGKHRPTMKEVASILEGIRSSTLPSILESDIDFIERNEIKNIKKMHDAHVSSSTSFSDKEMCSSSSSDVQPLMHLTI